jgi:hypothetical protein
MQVILYRKRFVTDRFQTVVLDTDDLAQCITLEVIEEDLPDEPCGASASIMIIPGTLTEGDK